jgi:PAS domain S-box-containing protein
MKAFAERLRKASIGLKLSLTFVFVIALCSLPMSLLTINYLSNKLKQHVMNTIEESVQSQKDEFIELILMENYWRAFNKIEALSQIPGVKEVVLVDVNDRIIASSKPEEKVVGRSFSSNPDYLKIPIESYSYTIGYLYYQIKREYIDGIVSPLRFITLAFTFFFTLVGVLLGVFVSLRINERLRQVREMIEEFKRGGMPTKKDFWERDELTELADFVHKSLSDLKGIFSNLEFARNFYESLFNTLQEIVLILDETGTIYFCNRAVENYGFSVENLLGRKVGVLLEGPTERREVRESLRQKGTYTGVVKLRNKKGEESYALSVLVPWVDAFIFTLKDITELKKSEELVKRMEVFSLLGEMSAYLAHELKNATLPLKLLSEVSEWNEDDIKVVKASIERVDKIVSSFLQFARPVEEEKREFSSWQLVEDVLKIYEPAIKKKDIDLVLDVMDFKLYTNKTALEITLSNLLKNAIEAVDGKGRIEISLRKEGEKTVLMVKDNGHGIPKKHIKKVFDPFFSTKRDSTGLGLSTVARYVQMLEGKLSVFSEEGKGSTFLVEVKA